MLIHLSTNFSVSRLVTTQVMLTLLGASHRKTNFRLRLSVLLDLRSSPTVLSTSILIAQSIPGHPHQQHTSWITLPAWSFVHIGRCLQGMTACAVGGDGGNRTPVLNSFCPLLAACAVFTAMCLFTHNRQNLSTGHATGACRRFAHVCESAA